MIFRLLNWQGMAGVAVAFTLMAMLTVQKLEAVHWKKQSENYEHLYQQEQAAFATTVASARAAARRAPCALGASAAARACLKAMQRRSCTRSSETGLRPRTRVASTTRAGTPAAASGSPLTTTDSGPNAAPGSASPSQSSPNRRYMPRLRTSSTTPCRPSRRAASARGAPTVAAG